MSTVRFQQVSARKVLTVSCRGCGKKLRRVVSETYTVNPFNKNAAGEPKSHGEVYADVVAEVARRAKALEISGTLCTACPEKP